MVAISGCPLPVGQTAAKNRNVEDAAVAVGDCPFAVKDGVATYLDKSLRRFETVLPACGSSFVWASCAAAFRSACFPWIRNGCRCAFASQSHRHRQGIPIARRTARRPRPAPAGRAPRRSRTHLRGRGLPSCEVWHCAERPVFSPKAPFRVPCRFGLATVSPRSRSSEAWHPKHPERAGSGNDS